MNKKITPLLFLFYVAFLAGTRAGAPGGVADQSLFPREKLTAIDTIVLKTPKVLLADPFNALAELYVRTATPIWGTSNFDDNFIHVSGNYSYHWTVGDILSYDPPSRRYDCQSTIPYLLADTLNRIHFHASYVENTVTYDTVANFEIRYAKPVVTVLAVNDDPYMNETVVVNSPTDVRIDVNLNRAYNLIDPDGYDKIVALDARLNSGGWSLVWNDPAGIRDLDLEIALASIAGSLVPGLNTLYFRSKGKCSNNCDEYSEIVTVKIFYLDYVAIGPQVCRYDQVTELTGIPEGGYFSGEGVLNQTTLFNSFLATDGMHPLTYHYLVDGGAHSISRIIEYVTPPDFDLSGDLEVCHNSWDMNYSIISLTGAYDNITWVEILGGEIQSASEDNSDVVIHWHGTGAGGSEISTGRMKVTMVKDGCSTTKEFLVDILNTIAPDPSFIMLYNKNLLVCDDTSANYFVWYHNGNMLDTTNVPYYFLGAGFTPANGNEFYVMTGFEVNEAACFTKSNVYVFEGNKSGTLSQEVNQIPVYPNPSNGNFTVLLPGNEDHEYVLTVSTLTGQQVASFAVNPSEKGLEYRVSGNDWPAGLYLLHLAGPSTSMFKKIMITR